MAVQRDRVIPFLAQLQDPARNTPAAVVEMFASWRDADLPDGVNIVGHDFLGNVPMLVLSDDPTYSPDKRTEIRLSADVLIDPALARQHRIKQAAKDRKIGLDPRPFVALVSPGAPPSELVMAYAAIRGARGDHVEVEAHTPGVALALSAARFTLGLGSGEAGDSVSYRAAPGSERVRDTGALLAKEFPGRVIS